MYDKLALFLLWFDHSVCIIISIIISCWLLSFLDNRSKHSRSTSTTMPADSTLMTARNPAYGEVTRHRNTNITTNTTINTNTSTGAAGVGSTVVYDTVQLS